VLQDEVPLFSEILKISVEGLKAYGSSVSKPHIKQGWLGKQCGFSSTTFSRMCSGDTSVSRETIETIINKFDQLVGNEQEAVRKVRTGLISSRLLNDIEIQKEQLDDKVSLQELLLFGYYSAPTNE